MIFETESTTGSIFSTDSFDHPTTKGTKEHIKKPLYPLHIFQIKIPSSHKAFLVNSKSTATHIKAAEAQGAKRSSWK